MANKEKKKRQNMKLKKQGINEEQMKFLPFLQTFFNDLDFILGLLNNSVFFSFSNTSKIWIQILNLILKGQNMFCKLKQLIHPLYHLYTDSAKLCKIQNTNQYIGGTKNLEKLLQIQK
ncbi:hypothetical protein BpHYR1_012328 [Brachionus plicatilis]|uniref:Uncharacterized protein n=1 Tax=Brachionus plicatilis TaxID=10195 RepID=A0A3M7RQ13_BRAPC|nr:hypothetical protein BpHYR1_012328 [Brachionus plicatilis]